MNARTAALVVVSAVTAAGCVRLGFWQLSRLEQRRAHNAMVSARMAAAPTSLDALPSDTGELHYRRVRVRGRLDFAHEVVLTGRTRNGSPGVHVITPLRIAGRDTAVLVNRGWIYSPNSADADLTRWREPDSLDAEGYAVPLTAAAAGARAAGSARDARAVRRVDREELSRAAGYPLAAYVVTLAPDAGEPPQDRPVRLPTPAVDEGAHMSYAIQWFAFASIAVVGAALYVRKAAG